MQNHHPSLLIAEDEHKLARLLSNFLAAKGYDCHHVDRGDHVEAWLAHHHADLLLLDIMMPGKDGFAVCQSVRNFSDIPIIMLTARVEQVDELLGLNLGADDYICKPFEMANVEARIRAALRRTQRYQENKTPEEVIELLPDAQQLKINHHPIELTTAEFRLFRVLYNNKGCIYSRNQLLDRIHDDRRVVTDRTIDTLIKSIRKKIASVFSDRVLIHSVYGVGYKFEI